MGATQRNLGWSSAYKALSRIAIKNTPSEGPINPKLLELCAKLPSSTGVNGFTNGDHIQHTLVETAPLTIQTVKLLLSLSDAVHLVEHQDTAEHLVQHLSPHVSEACLKRIENAFALRDFEPSPWELLTSSLTTALLHLGIRYPSLKQSVAASLISFADNCAQVASIANHTKAEGLSSANQGPNAQELQTIIILTTSIVGFLEAAAKAPSFWTPQERHDLIDDFETVLTQDFFIAVETALSAIRNNASLDRDMILWNLCLDNYAAEGRPLGAMLLRQSFLAFVEACAALMVLIPENLEHTTALNALMKESNGKRIPLPAGHNMMAEQIANVAAKELNMLEEGVDYLQLGSAWQQSLGYKIKGSCLASLLYCSLSDEEYADPDALMTWSESVLADGSQVADEALISSVLRIMAIVASTSPRAASTLCRSLPQFLVQGPFPAKFVAVAGECLFFILKLVPQDVVITTLYSMGNSLSANRNGETHSNYALFKDTLVETPVTFDADGSKINDSSLTLTLQSSEKSPSIYNNVIQTIVSVATGFNDEKITALALSMLVQKVGKISVPVDLSIITASAVLGAESTVSDFRALLRLYQRLTIESLEDRDERVQTAVRDAYESLSKTLKSTSDLYEIFLKHLLESIISEGEIRPGEKKQSQNVNIASQAISLIVRPLAVLIATNVGVPGIERVNRFTSLQRDAWYNIAVHGFSASSQATKDSQLELMVLANHSHPLITEELADHFESDIELNTVLRRGKDSRHTSELRKELSEVLPQCQSDIRALEYAELVFLKAAHLVEVLRASSGNCSKVLGYFVDPKLSNSAIGSCIAAVATAAVDRYIEKATVVDNEQFSAPYIAEQLSLVFEFCCHRVARVQQAAYASAERIIAYTPSALCQKTSVFTLLDLLNIMWASCLESETDEYEWHSTYTSPSGATSVRLSDDYGFRKATLKNLHKHAKIWLIKAINTAPLDVKGVLQTYLSDRGDDESLGHLSLGRSFALEMGAVIPATDHRLGAIDLDKELNVNTASDFMLAYTTRQEYRFTDFQATSGIDFHKPESTTDIMKGHDTTSFAKLLRGIEVQAIRGKIITLEEMREPLRRAAALLCRSTGSGEDLTIASYFVRIPFAVFTKDVIKFALSLWMGVIKENPLLESRIHMEIIEGWLGTVHTKKGLFSVKMHHPDPFYLQEEFAPSDKVAILQQQQKVHDLISPHFRVLQFLSSHYAATRLSSHSTEKSYHRLILETLPTLWQTQSHPLAREAHFHIILLSLRILRHSSTVNNSSRWRMKDSILSAALAWFANPPRWSFGGNRLKVKAETHLLADVVAALAALGGDRLTDNSKAVKSLHSKQELLQALISNEQTRLMVWLFPLDHSQRFHFASGHHDIPVSEITLAPLLQTAWDENPAIAVHMVTRFLNLNLSSYVRKLILQNPRKAIAIPEAVDILLGPALPTDALDHLHYLTYWAPVNPIQAVSYFLPAYKYHPSIIQYAVRALESHAVDVTFFYVPQIVQSLRYDDLGYIERYIVETAKVSQLFAHQIIWNMKANAFKDEDSEIPDPVKPTLDKVLAHMLESFSSPDKAFYEREFAFFNEITGISGKLRPFIKKSKPEKKQKIEEELRKIQVDVGVYLPSNPDGVVVGIDRKSGKPLQSHAKAPYMATFRIRKELKDTMEKTEEQIDEVNRTGDNQASKDASTYEVWQSAIFKVGDDCRQDVLALQMIAAFRGIFQNVGLPVYVFPYRVTATAPGCGVIDVLPNSISRDMLGREAVNGLYDWFVSKFGGEDAPAFQEARGNFVKSMAAYSIISYLLQFKDRHNGNIMLDEQGHILHIDFGFCFDIVPGGVKFERAPFKLTKEMIAVMGGSTNTQSFRWFEELCVKAFLASRPYVQSLAHMITCMLDSGLPCFKPETIQNFKNRFVLEKTEREAADYVRALVKKSEAHYSTWVYDEFQLQTNGIPF